MHRCKKFAVIFLLLALLALIFLLRDINTLQGLLAEPHTHCYHGGDREEFREFEVKKMHRCKKFAVIFLLLALSALIFLLRDINTLQITRQITLKINLNTIVLFEGSPPQHHNLSLWSCQGQKLSPEDALEEHSLLDSIDWPEHPHFPTGVYLKQTSDPAHSHFTILPAEGGRERHVGGHLQALIQMHDFQGRPKRYGGDVLLARLREPTLGAGVAGQVVDHLNGSYSAVLPLLWEGRAQVEVTLVHPSEAVTVLRRLTREQPDRIFFQSEYRSGSVSETTVCNVCLPASQQQPLCNHTDLHTGEPWYCYKPKQLNCDKRITHAKGGFNQNIRSNEQTLFQNLINMKVPVKASGSDSVRVLPKEKELKNCSVTPPGPSSGPLSGPPSGYYYQGVWRALGGTTVHQFSNASAITQCLRNKAVHMYGDSTARQWFEYLTATLPDLSVPDLKEMDLHSLKQVGPFMAVDTGHNILVKYRCHAPPIRFATVPTSELRYVANELDGLAGGPETVVVLGVWSHFSTFPVEVYIRRLRGIRGSVVRLLDRAPGTLVVVRTPNLKALDLYETLTNSDWYSWQQNRVLRAMFKGLSVVLVDAWEMTLAHDLPHRLHPQPPIIKNMIHVLLSNICPQTQR